MFSEQRMARSIPSKTELSCTNPFLRHGQRLRGAWHRTGFLERDTGMFGVSWQRMVVKPASGFPCQEKAHRVPFSKKDFSRLLNREKYDLRALTGPVGDARGSCALGMDTRRVKAKSKARCSATDSHQEANVGEEEKDKEVVASFGPCHECGRPVLEGQEKETYREHLYHKKCVPSPLQKEAEDRTY